MNVHWAPQSVFCGGLTKNLHYFQTVELFNPQDLRGKVETMLKSAGIKKPAAEIPNFDETFSGNKQQQKRWTHAEQFALEYYKSGIVRDAIRYYESFIRRQMDDLLEIRAIFLANLCVS